MKVVPLQTSVRLQTYYHLAGGLSTPFQSLKANILLSIAVAITSIAAPIRFSFKSGALANATPLQCFAASAALCSTSLGTTFTILGTTGLLKTRLGVVLTSAAMLDDVVGLVMVQIISNLGSFTPGFGVTTVIRSVFVSIAFAVMFPLICWLILRPVTLKLDQWHEKKPEGLLQRMLCRTEVALIFHTALLVAMVTASTYAGTSNLFAAYLAGAMISWWETKLPHPVTSAQQSQREQKKEETGSAVPKSSSTSRNDRLEHSQSGTAIYEKYYRSANEMLLKPFFFASKAAFSLAFG